MSGAEAGADLATLRNQLIDLELAMEAAMDGDPDDPVAVANREALSTAYRATVAAVARAELHEVARA